MKNHPGLPVTPEEIANSCLEAADAGAAVVHIHVRDPETAKPSMEIAYYREVIERIRAKNNAVILNVTTGPGGRYHPSDENPAVAGPRTTLMRPERRVEHIVALKPDIATLDLNTMTFGAEVVINTPGNVKIMAEIIESTGAKPELEVFDTGDIQLAHDLLKAGVLKSPAMFTIVTGVKYGLPSTTDAMATCRCVCYRAMPLDRLRRRADVVSNGGTSLFARRTRPRGPRRQLVHCQRSPFERQCRTCRAGSRHYRKAGRRHRKPICKPATFST